MSVSTVKGSLSLRVSAVNSLAINIASLTAWDKARSSASVLEVVTVSCLFVFHVNRPPNNDMVYP